MGIAEQAAEVYRIPCEDVSSDLVSFVSSESLMHLYCILLSAHNTSGS